MNRIERLDWLDKWIADARRVRKDVVFAKLLRLGLPTQEAYADLRVLIAEGVVREVKGRHMPTTLVSTRPDPATPPPPPPDEEDVVEADAELARIAAGTPEKPTGNGI